MYGYQFKELCVFFVGDVTGISWKQGIELSFGLLEVRRPPNVNELHVASTHAQVSVNCYERVAKSGGKRKAQEDARPPIQEIVCFVRRVSDRKFSGTKKFLSTVS